MFSIVKLLYFLLYFWFLSQFRIGSAAGLLRASVLHSDACHLYDSLVSLSLTAGDDRNAVDSTSGVVSGGGKRTASTLSSAVNVDIESLKRQIMLARGMSLADMSNSDAYFCCCSCIFRISL
jgi:hypothetical protein